MKIDIQQTAVNIAERLLPLCDDGAGTSRVLLTEMIEDAKTGIATLARNAQTFKK